MSRATVLLNDLLRTPEDFFDCVRRYTASVAATLVFGQRGATFKSFWAHVSSILIRIDGLYILMLCQGVFDVMSKVRTADVSNGKVERKKLTQLFLQWTEAMEAGANPPVDEYPILKLLPKQFCFWKRRAIRAGDAMDATWSKARSIVEERRAKGDVRDCVVDHLLDSYQANGFPMSQHAFNNLVGELVEGGADTTAAQLLTLILAFAKNPEVQKKARAQIDPLCGTARSPVWTDFKDLPYINAIVKEGMRWRPV